jgi:hypothetical protein
VAGDEEEMMSEQEFDPGKSQRRCQAEQRACLESGGWSCVKTTDDGEVWRHPRNGKSYQLPDAYAVHAAEGIPPRPDELSTKSIA